MAKHLVPASAYTGKSISLKSYKASSTPETQPIAKIRLRLFSFDKLIEVAVVDDISEDVLLGSDLGRSTLANWLLEADNSTKSVKVTQAQKKLEVEQDKVDIAASGASPHLLAEGFNFSDDFFSQEPIHATPPSSDSSELPLPELTVDHSDINILIAQQSLSKLLES